MSIVVPTFSIKKGDLLPSLTYDLRYADPNVDLAATISLSTAVTFSMMRRPTGDDVDTATPVITHAPALVESAADGIVRVRYDWQEGDTDVPGSYYGEFEFTISDEAPVVAPFAVILAYPFISDERRGQLIELLAQAEAEYVNLHGYVSSSPLSLPLTAPTRGYLPIDIAADLD